MFDETVADLMATRVVTCPLAARVPDIAREMTKHDISAVVVVDEEGCLAGLISRTDLVMLYGFEDMWPHLRARQVMSTRVHTVYPQERAVVAAQQIHNNKISRLIVVEPDGSTGKNKPIGILSITDIVRTMADFNP
jgi:CBS domain-containing protein